MTRAHRNINIAAVLLPFIAFIAAIPMLWNELVGPVDLILMLAIYAVSTIGITVGYHRLLTHRAFATHKWVEYFYALIGSLAVEGPVIGWVSDHRKHHAHADEEGDPHSPLVDGTLTAAFTAFFWAGLVRMFLVHHLTFSINSICHFFGRRRFQTDDRSTNVFWLAIPTFGESWHHNHHAFPRSAMHGLRWWEVDIGGLVIRAMRRLGLAWNVVLISPERQAQRKVEAAPKLRPTPPPRSAALER